MEEGCERDEVSAQLVRKKGTGMAGMVANNKKWCINLSKLFRIAEN